MEGTSPPEDEAIPDDEVGSQAAPAKSPARALRRAVYVSRVDTDGDSGQIVVGADYAVAAPLEPTSDTGISVEHGESATDRWLKENVPPHW